MKRMITKDHVKIFKGKYFLPWFQKNEQVVQINEPNKVIVFDLDETLGSFADLYILWRGIKHAVPTYSSFNDLCDLFPEFLRYGILTILEYLYDKKIKKECYKIFIYTNNQCSTEWVHLISKYLETRVKSTRKNNRKYVLFDQLICAFKIQNKPIEKSRTSHAKTLNDFIRCTLVSEHADFCFLDDVEYPGMKSAKVYYICPRPYIHTLSVHTIIKRITQSTNIIPEGILSNESFWRDWFHLHHRRRSGKHPNRSDIELDLQVSQKIIYHLKEFIMFGKKEKPVLYHDNKSTRKIKTRNVRKTKKQKTNEKLNISKTF